MTQNQIRYIEALETQRANQAREAENIRSNLAKEQENIRSNVAKERELNRSNLESERLNREKLSYDRYGNNLPATVIRTIKAEGSDPTLVDSSGKIVDNTASGWWGTVDKIGSSLLKPFGYKDPTPEQRERNKKIMSYMDMSEPQLEKLYHDPDTSDEDKEEIAKWIRRKRRR